MAPKKSDFLKSYGKMFEIIRALVNAVLQAGGDDGDLERISTDKSLQRAIAELIVAGKGKVAWLVMTIRETVTFSNLEAAISAGKYDWVNGDARKESAWSHIVPLEQEQAESEILVVHPNKEMTSEEVESWLDSQGLRSGNLYHLLKVGETQPELQNEFPIVALGSVRLNAFGDRVVACLYRGSYGRNLNLLWLHDWWNARCRFVAARK